MQDFVPIDTEETDPELQVDISCYPGYLGSNDLDGGLYLVKELSAFERFKFSKYMLEMEANEIIQLSLFCNSKNIKVIVREGYSVGEIIDQLPAIEVYKDNTYGFEIFFLSDGFTMAEVKEQINLLIAALERGKSL
jgi:hypothetical protein